MKDSIRFDTNNQEESEMNQASQSQAIIFSALRKMNKFYQFLYFGLNL